MGAWRIFTYALKARGGQGGSTMFGRAMLPVGGAILSILATAGRAGADVTANEGANTIFIETVARNAVLEPMLQINLRNPSGQPTVEVTSLTVSAGAEGTGDSAADLAADGVALYLDRNNDGRLTTTGTQPDLALGQGSFDGTGRATIGGLSQTINGGAQVNLLVVYTFGPTATAGKSYRARVAANADIAVRNASTMQPVAVTGAPVEGFLRTIGSGTLTIVRVTQSPDGATAIPNRTLLPLLRLRFLANDVEDIRLTLIDILDVGTAHGVTGVVPGSVRLFLATAAPTNPAAALASASFPADNGRAALVPGEPVVVPRNDRVELWFTVDCVSEAEGVIGSVYQVQLPQASPLAAAGAMSTDPPAQVIGAPITGPPWQFNYNPIGFSLASDPGQVLMPATARNYNIISFRVQNDTVARSETAQVRGFTFRALGTLNDLTAIESVQLYRDLPPLGKVSDNDVLLDTRTYNADNGFVRFDFASAPVNLGVAGTANFVVAYNLNGTAQDGQTASVFLNSRDDMVIIGNTSMANGAMNPSPFLGNTRTVGQPRAQLTFNTDVNQYPQQLPPGATDCPLLGFTIANGNDEDLLFKGGRFTITSDLNAAAFFTRLTLWRDINGNGQHDGQDVRLGAEAIVTAADGAYVVEWIVPEMEGITIAKRASQRFGIFADFSQTLAGDGTETFMIGVAANDDVMAVGVASTAQARFTAPTFPASVSRTFLNPRVELAHYGRGTQVLGCINGTYGLMGLVFRTPQGEDIILNRVRFQVTGTLDDAQFIAGGVAWNDRNRNFFIDTNEGVLTSTPFGVHVASSPVATDNGEGVIEFQHFPGPSRDQGTVAKNALFELTVGLGFAAPEPAVAQAQLGRNVQIHMAGPLVLEGVGARSGRPLEVSNPPGDDSGPTMTFDKGTLDVTLQPIERTTTPPNATDVEVFALGLRTSVLEDVAIDELRLRPVGTLNEALHIRPQGIKIYIDTNRNGRLDTTERGERLWAVLDPPAQDNGGIVFREPDYVSGFGNTVHTFPFGIPRYDQFLLTVDLEPTAPDGATIQFALESTGDLTASGACSLVPYQVGFEITYPTLPPLTGSVVTIQRGAVRVARDGGFYNDPDNVPVIVMAPSAVRYEVMRLDMSATAVEDIFFRGLTLRVSGTAMDHLALADMGVELFKGTIISQNRIAGGSFNADNGQVRLADLPGTITLTSEGAPADIRVALTGSGTAQLGTTIDLTFAIADLEVFGVSSGLPIETMLPETPFLNPTIRFGPGTLNVRFDDPDGFILPIPAGGSAQIQPFRLTATRTEEIVLNEVRLRGAGTADETRVSENGAVILNRRQSGSTTTIGVGQFTTDDGLAMMRGLNFRVAAGGNSGNQLSFDIALNPANAVVGQTLQFNLENAGAVIGSGGLTGAPVVVTLNDQAGSVTANPAEAISGRVVTLSNGRVTLKRGSNNQPNHFVFPNQQQASLMQLAVQVVSNLEAVTITELALCAAGTVDETTGVTAVHLYLDNGDGLVNPAGDVLIRSTTISANDGPVVFSGLQETYVSGTTRTWLVAADLTGAGQPGQTIQVTLCPPERPALVGTTQLTQVTLVYTIGSPTPVGSVLTISKTGPTPSPTPIPTEPPNRARRWALYE